MRKPVRHNNTTLLIGPQCSPSTPLLISTKFRFICLGNIQVRYHTRYTVCRHWRSRSEKLTTVLVQIAPDEGPFTYSMPLFCHIRSMRVVLLSYNDIVQFTLLKPAFEIRPNSTHIDFIFSVQDFIAFCCTSEQGTFGTMSGFCRADVRPNSAQQVRP